MKVAVKEYKAIHIDWDVEYEDAIRDSSLNNDGDYYNVIGYNTGRTGSLLCIEQLLPRDGELNGSAHIRTKVYIPIYMTNGFMVFESREELDNYLYPEMEVVMRKKVEELKNE